MTGTTLIIPGFHGSGPGHWQTWLEQRVTGARRVTGIDWETPVLVVESTNDPWMSSRTLTRWARCWGARVIGIGRAGHINTESGFGPWPQGLALLQCLPVAAGLDHNPPRRSERPRA